jgi:hypothetical protein
MNSKIKETFIWLLSPVLVPVAILWILFMLIMEKYGWNKQPEPQIQEK